MVWYALEVAALAGGLTVPRLIAADRSEVRPDRSEVNRAERAGEQFDALGRVTEAEEHVCDVAQAEVVARMPKRSCRRVVSGRTVRVGSAAQQHFYGRCTSDEDNAEQRGVARLIVLIDVGAVSDLRLNVSSSPVSAACTNA